MMEKYLTMGDVDGLAAVVVMALGLLYILGAKVGRLAYWVIALYLVAKVIW